MWQTCFLYIALIVWTRIIVTIFAGLSALYQRQKNIAFIYSLFARTRWFESSASLHAFMHLTSSLHDFAVYCSAIQKRNQLIVRVLWNRCKAFDNNMVPRSTFMSHWSLQLYTLLLMYRSRTTYIRSTVRKFQSK